MTINYKYNEFNLCIRIAKDKDEIKKRIKKIEDEYEGCESVNIDCHSNFLLVLVYENKLVVVKIIRDGVSEADNMPVIYICGVYSPPLKLTNESLVVIGSHTCPATITNLAVEDVN